MSSESECWGHSLLGPFSIPTASPWLSSRPLAAPALAVAAHGPMHVRSWPLLPVGPGGGAGSRRQDPMHIFQSGLRSVAPVRGGRRPLWASARFYSRELLTSCVWAALSATRRPFARRWGLNTATAGGGRPPAPTGRGCCASRSLPAGRTPAPGLCPLLSRSSRTLY